MLINCAQKFPVTMQLKLHEIGASPISEKMFVGNRSKLNEQKKSNSSLYD